MIALISLASDFLHSADHVPIPPKLVFRVQDKPLSLVASRQLAENPSVDLRHGHEVPAIWLDYLPYRLFLVSYSLSFSCMFDQLEHKV